MITAEEARKLTLKGIEVHTEHQLQEIQAIIRIAAAEGKNKIIMTEDLFRANKTKLEEAGFKVSKGYSKYAIEWGGEL